MYVIAWNFLKVPLKVRFLYIAEALEPEVKILSLSILSPDRPDIFLPIPEDGKPISPWFTLKEGSRYKLRFTFQVNNNIVLGLKYANTVWKTGMKGMLLLQYSFSSSEY